jgi:hypothetical protein
MIVFIAFEVFFMFNRTDKIKVAGVKSDSGGPALHSPVVVDKPCCNPTPCKKTHRVIHHFALQNIDMMFLDFAII